MAGWVTLTHDTNHPPSPHPPSCKKHVWNKRGWQAEREWNGREEEGGLDGGRNRRRKGVMLSVHGEKTKVLRFVNELGIDSSIGELMMKYSLFSPSLFLCLTVILTYVLFWSPGWHLTCCFLSFSLCLSWSDHTPHVSQAYQTGGNQQWFSKQALNQCCSEACNTCQSKPITFKQPSSTSTPLVRPLG